MDEHSNRSDEQASQQQSRTPEAILPIMDSILPALLYHGKKQK